MKPRCTVDLRLSSELMDEPGKQWLPRWMIVGFVLMGVTSFGGIAVLIMRALEKIQSGESLATYRTTWLVEFNYVGVLVLFGAILVALCVGGVMRFCENREWRNLEKKYADLGVRLDLGFIEPDLIYSTPYMQPHILCSEPFWACAVTMAEARRTIFPAA